VDDDWQNMSAKHIHLATEKKNTMGHSGRKRKGTQAMYLPGQKQRRTTDAVTMQEKKTLVVQAKKCIPTPTPNKG